MLSTFHLRQNLDRRFAAIPARMYLNSNLSAADRDVFGVIAFLALGKPEWVEVKQSEIAEFLGRSERSVKRSIANLAGQEEINIKRQQHAGNVYQVARPATGVSVSHSEEQQESRLKRCPKCQRSVKSLGKAGICRTCSESADLSIRIAAARAELGADATPEQLAAHLKNARLARRIRRILENAA